VVGQRTKKPKKTGVLETGNTYCSLARHFGLHSHRHGHRHSGEEHRVHYDIETGPHCSAVLKKTEQKVDKRDLFGDDVMLFVSFNNCEGFIRKLDWLLTAICLIRAITAVKYVVASLRPVVAGPISTPQLCTFGVICKIKPSLSHRYAVNSV